MKPLRIVLIAVAAVVLAPIALATGLYVLVSIQSRMAAGEQPANAAAKDARDCVGMQHNLPSAWDVGEEKRNKFVEDWLATCFSESAENPTPSVQHALADSLFHADRRMEMIAVLRELAAKGDADALLEIYEYHRSFQQGDVNRKQIVNATEAGESLRKAAELGHPKAISRYAVNLEQGGIIKRDIDAAVHWAQKSLSHPSKGDTQTDLTIWIARLLTETNDPEKQARGVRVLESINRPNAKAHLAAAIRKQEPARARALFEETLRAWPGISLAPLSEMLISGEGGPADPKRALKLLQSYSNASAPSSINAALGRLHAEGKLVPQDPQKAAELMSGATQWSVEARLEYVRFLADNPTVKVNRPKGIIYDVTNAIEVGEPGATATMIALKLSANPDFADKTGACRLAEQAVQNGDETARRFLSACTVN